MIRICKIHRVWNGCVALRGHLFSDLNNVRTTIEQKHPGPVASKYLRRCEADSASGSSHKHDLPFQEATAVAAATRPKITDFDSDEPLM